MPVPALKVAGHVLTTAENSHPVTVTKQSIAGTQHFARLLGFNHRPKPQLGPQGLLRQFWPCAEYCSNLRGEAAWSRPASFRQNPCLTDSDRHQFCLRFVFRRIACKCCRGWRADSFGSCFPVRRTGPQYNVVRLVVEQSVGRVVLVPPLIIL